MREALVLTAVLAWGLPSAWAAACGTPAGPAAATNEGVGVPFPGPPARQDLRESLSSQKECMRTIQPYRMSKPELQELRRAIRAQARMRMGEEPADRAARRGAD